MRARVFGVVSLVATSLAAPAYGAQVDFNWSGNLAPSNTPTLSVYAQSAPGVSPGTVDVFRCPAGGECDPTPLPRLADGTLDLSSAAAGDVFEARYSEGGTVIGTDRSPAWQGTPAIIAPPAITGQPTVGTVVGVVPTQWSGGWAAPWRAYGPTSLIACQTAAGTGCATVATYRPLSASLAGQYLFAAGSGFLSHSPNIVYDFAAPGFPVPNLAAGPGVTGPIGPVVDPAAQVFKAPAPVLPTASVRAKALRSKGRLSVARVTCPARCTVKLTVSKAGAKTVRRTLTVTGTQALTIAPRHGKLKVRVDVDGKTVASGTSRAR